MVRTVYASLQCDQAYSNNAMPSCSKVILLLEKAEDSHSVFGN